MAKIVHVKSGPQSLEAAKQPASTGVTKVEVVVTPEPKTKDQRLANAQAQRTAAAAMRQEQNAHAPSKLRTQKTARRKRKRDNYYKAVQAALAAGRITLDEAKQMLPTRQPRVRND